MVFGLGKKKGTSGSKKRKGSHSNAAREEQEREEELIPEVEQLAGFPEVVFISDEHRNNFVRLLALQFEATHFIDEDLLDLLGIREQTRTLFQNMGLINFFHMHEPTYLSLTLEFLCSLRVYKDESYEALLEFRLCNRTHQITFEQFAGYFGLSIPTTHLEKPRGFNEFEVWKAISGLNHKARHYYAFQIHHPVIRIWHRFIAGSILGRFETGKVTHIDLSFLESYLRVQGKEYNFNTPLEMLKRFRAFAQGTNSSKGIVFGGLITVLAEALVPGFNDDETYDVFPGETDINESVIFKFHKWCEYNNVGHIIWLTRDGPSVILPTNLPPVVPRQGRRGPMPNYLLREEQPYVPPPPRVEQRRASTSQIPQGWSPFLQGIRPSYAPIPPYPHTFTPYEFPPPQDPLSATDHLMKMMNQMDLRIHQGHKDDYFAQYPAYYHMAQAGYIDPQGPTPSWVDHQRMFPNFRAEREDDFDEGEAGGSNPRGNNNEDENIENVEEDDNDAMG